MALRTAAIFGPFCEPTRTRLSEPRGFGNGVSLDMAKRLPAGPATVNRAPRLRRRRRLQKLLEEVAEAGVDLGNVIGILWNLQNQLAQRVARLLFLIRDRIDSQLRDELVFVQLVALVLERLEEEAGRAAQVAALGDLDDPVWVVMIAVVGNVDAVDLDGRAVPCQASSGNSARCMSASTSAR